MADVALGGKGLMFLTRVRAGVKQVRRKTHTPGAPARSSEPSVSNVGRGCFLSCQDPCPASQRHVLQELLILRAAMSRAPLLSGSVPQQR